MPYTNNNLPDGYTTKDIRRIQDFVHVSKGIPQLAKARVHALTMLWTIARNEADKSALPQLEPTEIEILLRTSDLYVGDGFENNRSSDIIEAA